MRDSEGRDVWRILATFVFIPIASFSIGSTGTYFIQTRQIRETQIEYGQRIATAERALLSEVADRRAGDDSKDKVTETRVTNILQDMRQLIMQNTEIIKQNSEIIAMIKVQQNLKP